MRLPAIVLLAAILAAGVPDLESPLALTDLSIRVVDLEGRPLSQVSADLRPRLYGEMRVEGGVIVVRAIPSAQTYILRITWNSAAHLKEASSTIALSPGSPPEEVELPVGDIRLKVLDPEGRPIPGARVYLGRASALTDAEGEAVFQLVPLEYEGSPISYEVRVEVGGQVVFRGVEEVSRSRTTLTLVAELYDLKIRVVGAAGQPLPYAEIVLKRGGVVLGEFTADRSGALVVEDVPPATYLAEAGWRGFRGSTTITVDDLRAGRIATIQLPPYAAVLGIPLTFSALIALILGLILLIVVLAMALYEYIAWRGRRTAVKPPKARG